MARSWWVWWVNSLTGLSIDLFYISEEKSTYVDVGCASIVTWLIHRSMPRHVPVGSKDAGPWLGSAVVHANFLLRTSVKGAAKRGLAAAPGAKNHKPKS